MGCGCHRDPLPNYPRSTELRPVRPIEDRHAHDCYPTGPLHQHHNQSPTFLSREAVPCKKPPFIPNQPPVPPHHGCCELPPPQQKGPYEYIPSRLYPDKHFECGHCCDDDLPFVPNQPMIPHQHPTQYQCMPKQGRLPCKIVFHPENPPRYGVPPIMADQPCDPMPPRHRCAEPGDVNHPAHYPGLVTPVERPEPFYGVLKIRAAAPTTDGEMTAVQYMDGRYDMIPKGYVMDDASINSNGPRCVPWDDIRGNTSDSEGMDCLNYHFNNSDNGASF